MSLVAFRELHGHAEVDELVFVLLQINRLGCIHVHPVTLGVHAETGHPVVEILDLDFHATFLKHIGEFFFEMSQVHFHVRTIFDINEATIFKVEHRLLHPTGDICGVVEFTHRLVAALHLGHHSLRVIG